MPETEHKWHRELVRRNWTYARRSTGGRPRLNPEIANLIVRLARENPRWGYGKLEIEIRYTPGSQKRIQLALDELGYQVPNTSAIERRNGTARAMSKAQVRKTLAFAKREDEKLRLGWWNLTVYNWGRAHRSLRPRLAEPAGKKFAQYSPAMALGLADLGGALLKCGSLPSIPHGVGDNLTRLPEMQHPKKSTTKPGIFISIKQIL